MNFQVFLTAENIFPYVKTDRTDKYICDNLKNKKI